MASNRNSTVILEFPISVDGVLIEELNLSRPKVKHIKAVNSIEDEIQKAVTLISKLADISEAAVEDLDAKDFAACSVVIEGFMEKKSHQTGKN